MSYHPTPNHGANMPPLPSNWEIRYDENSGYNYFVNHDTKTTQWEDPRLVNSNTYSSQQPNQNSQGTDIPIEGIHGTHYNSNHHQQNLGNGHHNKQPLNRHVGQDDSTSTSSGADTVANSPAMKTIAAIRADAEKLHADIEGLTGSKSSHQYKYLEEMMERNLCKLDNVETNGIESVRLKRKETVKYIQQCLDQMELKAMANDM